MKPFITNEMCKYLADSAYCVETDQFGCSSIKFPRRSDIELILKRMESQQQAFKISPIGTGALSDGCLDFKFTPIFSARILNFVWMRMIRNNREALSTVNRFIERIKSV